MALPLPIALLISLAASNAPEATPETIAALAETESGRNPLAVYDNTTRRTYAPDSQREAAALTRTLIGQGHSLDLGLMQINNANLSRTGAWCRDRVIGAEAVGDVGERLLS